MIIRKYKIGDPIKNRSGLEFQVRGIDDPSGETDVCYTTFCTKCNFIHEGAADILEKKKFCSKCEKQSVTTKTDGDGISTVQENDEMHKRKTYPSKAADLNGNGEIKMNKNESNEKMSGAVAKHTPDNETSDHKNNTNLQENCNMKKSQKPDIRKLLSKVAIKPGDIPNIKYEKKQTVIKASGSIPKNTFFRAHHDHEYDFMMIQVGKEMESKMYIIGPGLTMPAHVQESTVYIACHLIIFPDGDLRIFERKIPSPGEPLNEYQRSSLNVIEAAKKGWVTRKWNKSAGVYDHFEAGADYAPEPSWPEDDYMDLLIKAYEGRIIDSVDHPVYLELAGKKAITD